MTAASRYIIVSLLVLALLAQHSRGLLLMADYYVNTNAYLAKCENKWRPQLNCNGQCLLMKKIKAAEQKENQSPERKIDWKFEVISTKSYYYSVQPVIASAVLRYFIPVSTGVLSDRAFAIYHPPCV